MAVKSKAFQKGVRLKGTTDAATLEGEIRNDSAAQKAKIYIEGSEKEIVTDSQTQTLSNKTVDADNNSISNLEVDNLKVGVLNTDLSGPATDTEIPSALAVKSALALQNEASEIDYDNSTSGLTSTTVQAAIDEVEERVDTAETDITELEANQADLITLSGVVENSTDLGTFTGTTISDNVDNKVALQELETSLELKANSDGATITTATITDATIQTSSIEDPTRLDMRKDTLANLETYATTATDGQLVFSVDTLQTFQIVGNELVAVGGAQTVKLIAGEDLVLNDLVYVSTGTGNDSGRTAGQLYKVDISNDDRIEVLGLVVRAATSTNEAEVQFAGELAGLVGLTIGGAYFAGDTVGTISDTATSLNNVWSITIGLAVSETSLIINPVSSASATFIQDAQETKTILNNQSTAVNLDGVILDPQVIRSFVMNYSVQRKTDTASSEVVEVGQFRAAYNSQAGTYVLSQDGAGSSGVDLSVQPSGQIQYTSTDITGANYVGSLTYKLISTFGV